MMIIMSAIKEYKSEGNDFFEDMENNDKSKYKSDLSNNISEKTDKEEKAKNIDNKTKETKEVKETKETKEVKEAKDDKYIPDHVVKENKTNVEQTIEIKPKLVLLEESNDSSFAYIGRKKSVLKQYGSKSSAFLGRIVESDLEHKNIRLDGLNPHVVFIDGSRGSGKSYGLGVIAEELAVNNTFIGQIVVDPVGVFWSMKFPNQEKKEIEILKEWGLEPKGLDNLKVFVPFGMANKISKDTYDETFSMFPSMLEAEDWCLTFGIERFNPTGLLLEKTLSFVKDGYIAGDPKEDSELKEILPKGNQFTLDDIIYCLHNNTEFKSSQKGYKPDSIRALVSRFEASKSWGIFSDHGTPLTKLSREGQLTVLDTSFLDDNITALVIGILARRILAARKLVTRQDAIKKFDTKEENPDLLLEIEIPPTWLYIDEAHTLIPSGNTMTPATAAIIEYVKQGRRPGCSLVFATQQPSAINSKVLSQVDVFISHKLVFNDDIKAIHNRMPAIIPEEYKKPNFIKTLPVGVALVGDRREESSRAFILKIKPRASQHEGRDAETIRLIEELSEEEIILRASELIFNKIKKTKKISENYAKDILDIVNIKYHSSVVWKKVLEKLNEYNIILKNKELFIRDENYIKNKDNIIDAETNNLNVIKEEINKLENSNIQDDISNDLEELKEDIDSIEINEELELADKEHSFICECFPLRISKEMAENKAKSTTLKKYLFFKNKETVNESSLYNRIIYKIHFNLYDKDNNFKRKVCYADSITGELLHFINNNFRASKGLIKLPLLSESDLELLYLLKRQSTIYSLTQEIDLDEELIKERIDFFKNNDFINVVKKHDVEVYKLSDNFDIPFSANPKIIDSINTLPLRKKELPLKSIFKIENNINDIKSNIQKLWGNIEFISTEEIYWPVWKIVLVDSKFKEREVLVDGVVGQLI
jgi:uncharacterized protein